MTTLTLRSLDEVSAAVAEHCAGYVKRGSGWEMPPMRAIFPDIPDFARSSDAVLPLLEKMAGSWNGNWSEPHGEYWIYIRMPFGVSAKWDKENQFVAVARDFPTAACLALLQAMGFTVEYQEATP